MAFELSQELQDRIEQEAVKHGTDPETLILQALKLAPAENELTWGAKLLARWKADGATPIWQDRSDSLELAAEFRQNFARKVEL